MYFYQLKEWPDFRWNSDILLSHVSRVRDLQGRLIGRMEGLGFDLREEAMLITLTEDILKSSEIEGEFLNAVEVRSSVARGLGMDIAGLTVSGRDVDGVVEMMLDATQNFQEALTNKRLFEWHAALFPAGRNRKTRISVGVWRDDSEGPMQVVSGVIGREKVHFVAPDAANLEMEMDRFINWFNSDQSMEAVIKSAVAHIWFVSIHPFNDGNGRIARAIADMQLARADKSGQRFYSMSSQILKSKNGYYSILESTQKGSLDISHWLVWYMERMMEALSITEETLSKILFKAHFWEIHKNKILNERKKDMLNKLLGDFNGKLTSSKWGKMNKVHRDTARRDIHDLIEKGVLQDSGEGGRSTNYILIGNRNVHF